MMRRAARKGRAVGSRLAIKAVTLAALAWLATGPPAAAANDPCVRPASADERAICADPALAAMRRALDRRVAKALELSLDPSAFRAGQAAWVSGLALSAPTRALLEKTYADRLTALDEMTARSGAKDALLTPVAEVRDHCLAVLTVADAACKPVEFGEIGAVDGRAFAYARYEYAPNDFEFPRYTRIVAFERVGSTRLRAVVSPDASPADAFDKPAILRSRDRVLLHIPCVESGAAPANCERLFLWRAGAWRAVDATSWLDDLRRRTPEGYSAIKGIFPDYLALKASTPLWKDSDDVDCPSGPRVEIALKWRGDQIALAGLRSLRAGPCAKAPSR